MATPHATPVYFQTGADSAGVGALTVAWPSLTETDDIGLLVVETSDGSASLSTAAGFVAVSGSPVEIASTTRLAVYWCRATSSSPTSPVVADSGDHQIANIFLVKGCAVDTDPIHAVSTTSQVAAGAPSGLSITGLTTTVANCLIMVIASMGIDNATADLVSSWANSSCGWFVEIGERGTTSGDGGYHATARGVMRTAGVVGTSTATRTGVAASTAFAAMTIALMPPQIGADAFRIESAEIVYAPALSLDLFTIKPGRIESGEIIYGGDVAQNDATTPVISNMTPADGTSIRALTSLEFDVTDDTGLSACLLFLTWTDPDTGSEEAELIYDGDGFRGKYDNASYNTASAITGGLHFRIRRAGGWPQDPDGVNLPISLEAVAVDGSGNIGVAS